MLIFTHYRVKNSIMNLPSTRYPTSTIITCCHSYFFYFRLPDLFFFFFFVILLEYFQVNPRPHIISTLITSIYILTKDPEAGNDWRQEEKGTTENEVVGWHHRLGGCEFEQAPGVGDGQGSLACCSPWGSKESDTTEQQIWTGISNRLGLLKTILQYHLAHLTKLLTIP